MTPDRLRCGVAKFKRKSIHSDVTIHSRTWVPYLILLPTPSPTRENFLMQDFPTTLYRVDGQSSLIFVISGYLGYNFFKSAS